MTKKVETKLKSKNQEDTFELDIVDLLTAFLIVIDDMKFALALAALAAVGGAVVGGAAGAAAVAGLVVKYETTLVSAVLTAAVLGKKRAMALTPIVGSLLGLCMAVVAGSAAGTAAVAWLVVGYKALLAAPLAILGLAAQYKVLLGIALFGAGIVGRTKVLVLPIVVTGGFVLGVLGSGLIVGAVSGGLIAGVVPLVASLIQHVFEGVISSPMTIKNWLFSSKSSPAASMKKRSPVAEPAGQKVNPCSELQLSLDLRSGIAFSTLQLPTERSPELMKGKSFNNLDKN